MKRILFTLNNMNIGGTEKAFLNYVNTLSPDEYDVTLLLLEEKGGFLPFVPGWIHIRVMDNYPSMKEEIMAPPLQVAKSYLKEGKAARAFCIAVLHCYFKLTDNRIPYYKYVLKGCKESGNYDTAIAYCGPFDFLTVYVLYFVRAAKKIQWIHFDVSKFHFNTKICRKMYPKYDEIRVVSDEAKRQLLKKIPEIANKTITVPNVVSAEQCKKMADMGTGFTDCFEGIRIVTVGRLSEEKGQDIIPEVAARLKKAGRIFKWYLIGDGKLRPVIEQKCDEYDVVDNIVFLGVMSNPYPYLKQADLYVQTSKHEGFCITLGEAKVFDLPIVSTDCAGAHEQLDGRENCRVVERNTEDLYAAIVETIGTEQT